MFVRIIPRLDIKGPNLVKGIHLEGVRVLGKPEQYAKHYYQAGADELLYMDVVASLYERNSLHEIISRTAEEIFIPLTVGGGIRSIDDVKSILRAGADKVSINTAAVKNPQLISEAANIFGSSTIVIAIEAIKQDDGNYYAFTDNGREKTDLEIVEWAKEIERLGAGEIILTSVDKEGTGQGFDLVLTKKITQAISIPVIAHGGAGQLEDIKDVVLEGKVDAVSLASMLHYNLIKNNIIDTSLEEGSNSFIKSGQSFSSVDTLDIHDIKNYLQENNILCRI
jgi:imidazole glycerol-phosphate synthase subunit HisF